MYDIYQQQLTSCTIPIHHWIIKLTGGALMFTVFEAERVVQSLVAVTVNVCEDPRLIRELPTLAVMVTWTLSPAPTVARSGLRNLLKPSTGCTVKLNATDP